MTNQRYNLKNGLRVILIPIQEMGSATTMLMVGAGSRYEGKTNNGISHFLEHMAFKGTKKRPSALEIATLIDGIGAEQNAFTGKEYTGYYVKSSSDHIGLCFDILSDMLSNLLLDAAEIDKERGVILEEINLYEDTPVRKIGDVFEHLLYGDTPMGWDIAGEKEVIRKIQREDFMSYMKQLYSADNMALVVAGKMNVEKVKKQIEEYFSGFSAYPIVQYEKVNEVQSAPQVTIKHKKTEQAHFALGVRTVGLTAERERYPLSILAAILGGGMSSRLFHEVREKRGLAYYVRSYSESYTDLGYLATFAGVDPKRIDDAIKVVINEYEKILKSGEITPKELQKAREYVKGHFVLELEDTKSVASYYAIDEILEKKVEDPDKVVKKIESVTLKEVQEIAERFFTPKALNLAVIGDYKDPDRFQKLLG